LFNINSLNVTYWSLFWQAAGQDVTSCVSSAIFWLPLSLYCPWMFNISYFSCV